MQIRDSLIEGHPPHLNLRGGVSPVLRVEYWICQVPKFDHFADSVHGSVQMDIHLRK